MKKYYFMAGLPRSGSTLLKALINQNPKVHTEPVSPILELMYYSEEYFLRSEQYIAYPKPERHDKVIRSYFDNYYFDVEKDVIIDHNRAWPNNIDRLKRYITPNPKIICPVRDVHEILASFITLMHRSYDPDNPNFVDVELIKGGYTIDDDNRCQYLMGNDGIVDQALWSNAQALRTNNGHHLLFVEYNDLVNDTRHTMRRIYDFLEVDYYENDLDNVINTHREDEGQWKLSDMHEVRRKVQKTSKTPEEVLSPRILNKYKNLEYWKNSESPYLKG